MFYNLSHFDKYSILQQWLRDHDAIIYPNFSGDLDCAYWIIPRNFSFLSDDLNTKWQTIHFYYNVRQGQEFAFEFTWDKEGLILSESDFINIVNQKMLNDLHNRPT